MFYPYGRLYCFTAAIFLLEEAGVTQRKSPV